MALLNIHAAYFSPTDTTKITVERVAEDLARALSLPMQQWDFTLPKGRETPASWSETDLVVFGVPVYAGRVPNVLLNWLRTLRGNGALAVPVVVFGNRAYEDALIELRDILETDGFATVAGGAFVGEHSFSRTLGAGRPDAQDLAAADNFAAQIAQKLQKPLPTPHAPIAVKGNVPLKPYYKPRDDQGRHMDIRRVHPETTADCIHCGLCAAVCPMGSIDPADVTKMTGICIKCCACVKKCPQNAKYFDDPDYLLHKKQLEDAFTDKRAQPEWFV